MLIVFDLDGTLIDSAKDLAISMNATRTHLGMAPLDPNLIYSFVGNGAAVLVKRALGPDASEELNRQALEFFLQYYRAHALEHTHLYPGVRESLEKLHGAVRVLDLPDRAAAEDFIQSLPIVAAGIVAAEPIPTQPYDGLELLFGSVDGATTPGVR